MALDPELLKILACPVCKTALAYDVQKPELSCAACSRRFSVQDDIPDLVVRD